MRLKMTRENKRDVIAFLIEAGYRYNTHTDLDKAIGSSDGSSLYLSNWGQGQKGNFSSYAGEGKNPISMKRDSIPLDFFSFINTTDWNYQP